MVYAWYMHAHAHAHAWAWAWYMHGTCMVVYARLLGQQLAPIDEGLRLANEHLALGSRRVAPRGELGGEDGVEARGE